MTKYAKSSVPGSTGTLKEDVRLRTLEALDPNYALKKLPGTDVNNSSKINQLLNTIFSTDESELKPMIKKSKALMTPEQKSTFNVATKNIANMKKTPEGNKILNAIKILGGGVKKGVKAFGKNYEYPVLPILAVIETIATQGKSPGTAALGQMEAIETVRANKARREAETSARKESELNKLLKLAELKKVSAAEYKFAKQKEFDERSKLIREKDLSDKKESEQISELYNEIFPEKASETDLYIKKLIAQQEALEPSKIAEDKRKREADWEDFKRKFDYKNSKAIKNASSAIDPDTGKPFKSTQFSAGTYAFRMEEANKVLDELESSGYRPGKIFNWIVTNGIDNNIINQIRSPEDRRYVQATRNIINATLRRESGAAIAPSEFESGQKQYFAGPGDDVQTLEQKRDSRLQTLAGFKAEAGNAYNNIVNEYNKLSKPKTPAAVEPTEKEFIWNEETNQLEEVK